MNMVLIVALIAAIVLISLVQLARALLAAPIARIRCLLQPAFKAPLAWADLSERTGNELLALGFTGPHWCTVTQLDPDGETRARACYVHPSGHVAGVSVPTEAAPHMPQLHFSSAVGEHYVESHRFDWSVPISDTSNTHHYCLNIAAIEACFAAHVANCQRHTGLIKAVAVHEIPAFLEAINQHEIEGGIATGSFKRYADGRVRLSYRACGRALLRYYQRGKAPSIAAAIPPARLAWFAHVREQTAHRAPPTDRQWSIFLSSVALSLALGWLVFGGLTSSILLVVILIHELGHFLAMRAFGYRNLQMLALPLVGGVAIGKEREPNAHHRAWMALMGPLPGIAIGISMLVYAAFHSVPDWFSQTSWMFIGINVFNLLPFPPLDGSLVMKALARRNPYTWAAWTTVIGGVIGLVVAYYAGMTLLMLIIGFQLFTVPVLFANAKQVRKLQAHGLPELRLAESVRLTQVLGYLDATEGTCAAVQPRLQNAQAALETQRIRPMGAWQRVLVFGVLSGALLIVPLGFMATVVAALSPLYAPAKADASWKAIAKQDSALRAELADQASTMALPELVRSLAGDKALPASEQAIAQAERRLGQNLPEELKKIYALSDAIPGFLDTPKRLRVLNNFASWEAIAEYQDAQSDEYDEDGEPIEARSSKIPDAIWFSPTGGGAELAVNPNTIAPLLRLNRSGTLVYDLSAKPIHQGHVVYQSDMSLAPTLLTYLRSHWAQTQFFSRQQERRESAIRSRAETLTSRSTAELLAMCEPKLPFLLRLMSPAQTEREGASENDITALETRLGHTLASDHRTILRTHNGVAMLQLLATNDIASVSANSNATISTSAPIKSQSRRAFLGPLTCALATPCPEQILAPEALDQCIQIGGTPLGRGESYASLMWCPKLTGPHHYIDASRKSYQSLNEWLAWRAGMGEQALY